jgi:N-acetylneuraminic acid mutarotase
MIQSSIGKLKGVEFPSSNDIYYNTPSSLFLGASNSYITLSISPASLYQGEIHIWSGNGDTENRYAKYNIENNTWSYVTMPAKKPGYRYGHAGGIIGDYFYIFGGRYTAYYNDTWRYNIAANTWSNMSPSSPPAVRYHVDKQSTVVGDKLYVLGGYDASTYVTDFWVYDSTANTWTSLATPTNAVYHCGAITSYDGKIYYLRGNQSPAVRNLLLCYDIATNTWNETLEDAPTKLYWSNLVSMGDGNLVAVSGYISTPSAGATPYAYGSDLAVYNIKANRWRFGGATSLNRYHTARAVLYKGKIYVHGGHNGHGYQPEMVIYPNPLSHRYTVREEY